MAPTDWKDQFKEHNVKRVKFFHERDPFKQDLEEAVGALDPQQIEHLRQQSNENSNLAVNIYLDSGTQETAAATTNTSTTAATSTTNTTTTADQGSQEKPIEFEDNDNDDDDDDIVIESGSMGLFKNWSKRFIGSFQATIWATRSGQKLVQYGEKLYVKRDIPDTKTRLSNLRPINPVDNIIVRLAKYSTGLEVARLSEADARFTSILIDSGLCDFSATCIFSNDSVRIGDSIIVQVDCFLKHSAFYSDLNLPPSLGGGGSTTTATQTGLKKTANGLVIDSENGDEKFMRLRQNGLVQMFNKLNLEGGAGDDIRGTTDMASAAEVMGTQLPTEMASDTELDQDQLDSLYKRTVPPDTNLEELEPPKETFALELRPYQKRGLNWMVQKETIQEQHKSEIDEPMHPLWRAVKWPSQLAHLEVSIENGKKDDEQEQDDSDEFYVNLYSGELSLNFPRQKKSVLGGVLADEMGLGKTISTLALIHSNKYSASTTDSEPFKNEPDYARHTTLVVAPMSLLSQWASEVDSASRKGSMRTHVYYGSDASGINLKSMLCSNAEHSVPNILITSYGTLLSEYSTMTEYLEKRGDPANELGHDLQEFGLFGIKFFRVVMDEGHTIRNRSAKTTKAAYALRANRRWVLTGTPIVNRLDDLFSIVKFLGVEPWNNYSFWKAFVSAPFENNNNGNKSGFVQAMNVVQSIMEPLVLRRTKDMKQHDGTPLVQLPPKTVTIHRIKFSSDEEALYRHVFARVKSSFKDSLEAGNLMKSYTHLLSQILRLRQVCCHPALVSGAYSDQQQAGDDNLEEGIEKGADPTGTNIFDMEEEDLKQVLDRFTVDQEDDSPKDASSFGATVVQSILQGVEQNCPLCLEPIEEDQRAVTACWHMACLDCLVQQIEFERNKGKQPRCATCRTEISADKIYQVKRSALSGNLMLQKYHSRGQSSKIKELLSQLHQIYRTPVDHHGADPIRTVVFSQFTSYLNLIQRELEREGFFCLRFDGTMSQKKRAQVLDEFKSGTKNTVLLISLKAGGVGLNLVCANRAYLMDPWWSYAVESQAIDRIHRMGQLSEVQVVRFIVEDSIEERILKIQDRKKFLATTLGMSEEEKRAQRLDDIKLLFE